MTERPDLNVAVCLRMSIHSNVNVYSFINSGILPHQEFSSISSMRGLGLCYIAKVENQLA